MYDTQQRVHHWQDYKKHWLIVNFWASWCAPCRKEVPELNQLQQRLPDVKIIGISFDPLKPQKLLEESQKLGFKFPVLQQDLTHLLEIERPSALPTTVIFSPGLKHFKTLRGPQTADEIQAILAKENNI